MWRLLAIVVLIALPVRVYLAVRATMISRDGTLFITYAQRLADDPLAEMRSQAQHPLYPAMVLAAHGGVHGLRALGIAADALADPVRSWSLAAITVTLVGGLAVVIAIYVLASSVFDRRIGLIAAGLAALTAEFCQLSADALTDMPHLALYLFALAAAIRGVRARRMRWLFVAGILSGTAFLMRPEGAEAAVAAVAAMCLPAAGWSWRRRIVGIILVGAGAGLVASPYMLATGKLVKKKPVDQFLGGAEQAQTNDASLSLDTAVSQTSRDRMSRDRKGAVGVDHVSGRGLTIGDRVAHVFRRGLAISSRHGAAAAEIATPPPKEVGHPAPVEAGHPITTCGSGHVIVDVGRAVGLVAEDWLRSLRVTFLLPAVAWLILRRRPRAEPTGQRLILTAGLLHLLILISLIIRFDYAELFSVRHVMVLAGLTLPLSAAGIAAILHAAGSQRRRVATVALAVVLIGPTLPWLLETRYLEDAHLRRAGEWIRAHDEGTPRIFTTRRRVPFYANGTWVESPHEADAGLILGWVRDEKPDWLVFDEHRMLRESPHFFEDLESAGGASLQLVWIDPPRDQEARRRVIVYRYRPAR